MRQPPYAIRYKPFPWLDEYLAQMCTEDALERLERRVSASPEAAIELIDTVIYARRALIGLIEQAYEERNLELLRQALKVMEVQTFQLAVAERYRGERAAAGWPAGWPAVSRQQASEQT